MGELQDSGPSRWGWPPEMATFPLPAVSCGIGTPSGRALAGPESQMGRLMQCSRANREIGEWDSEIERRHDSRK